MRGCIVRFAARQRMQRSLDKLTRGLNLTIHSAKQLSNIEGFLTGSPTAYVIANIVSADEKKRKGAAKPTFGQLISSSSTPSASTSNSPDWNCNLDLSVRGKCDLVLYIMDRKVTQY